MDVLSVISIKITIIGFIVKMASGEETNHDHAYEQQSFDPTDPFQEGTLDAVVNCYESFRLSNFNVNHLAFNLTNANHAMFTLQATRLKGNCLNLKIQFLDVFDKKGKNGETREFRNHVTTYFSVNYLADIQNVMIYGCSNYNQRLVERYKEIASEIRNTIST